MISGTRHLYRLFPSLPRIAAADLRSKTAHCRMANTALPNHSTADRNGASCWAQNLWSWGTIRAYKATSEYHMLVAQSSLAAQAVGVMSLSG